MLYNNCKIKSDIFDIEYELNDKSIYHPDSITFDKFSTEIKSYVHMMKQIGVQTIVEMNKYLTRNNLWSRFPTIVYKNIYANGFSALGISKAAYLAVNDLIETQDKIKTNLLNQKKVNVKEL